eukprot:TRINITY_DN3129_c0_g1_i9.p1 TRINITY_DN3129_c0_g1~~TRINITY_DN3129_c0_g1_i9.p1  ORF type:complete len:183 (-),score=18.33 TRINITY_DN3129_c0_g1_i9:515-1063(-)
MAQQFLCRTARCSFSNNSGQSMQLRIYLVKCKEILESSVLRWFRFLQRFWVLQASSNNNRTQKSRSRSLCFFFLSGQGKVAQSDGEGRGCGFQRQPSFVSITESSPTSAVVVLLRQRVEQSGSPPVCNLGNNMNQKSDFCSVWPTSIKSESSDFFSNGEPVRRLLITNWTIFKREGTEDLKI